jgi:hypothetical protein
VIVALCCAVLFVVAVYFVGQYVLEGGRVKETRVTRFILKSERPSVEADTEIVSDKTPSLATQNATADEQQPIDELAPQVPAPLTERRRLFHSEVAEKSTTKPEAVSPHGFGPYPEIPADFPRKVVWKASIETHPNFPLPPGVSREDFPKYAAQQSELFNRVMIKAWNEGDHAFTGGSISYITGKVYLTYPRTVYVKYRSKELPDGTVVKEVAKVIGDRNVPRVRYAKDFPDDVRVIDYESAGIDPYGYLDLP